MLDVMRVIIHILRPLSESWDCAFHLQETSAEEDKKQKRNLSVSAFVGTSLCVFFSLIKEKAGDQLHTNARGPQTVSLNAAPVDAIKYCRGNYLTEVKIQASLRWQLGLTVEMSATVRMELIRWMCSNSFELEFSTDGRERFQFTQNQFNQCSDKRPRKCTNFCFYLLVLLEKVG